MAEALKKSNWFKRHKIWTGIIIALLFFSVIGALGSSNSPTTLQTSSTTSDSSANSASGSTGNTTSSTSSSSASQHPYVVGDSITMSDIAVTLTKVVDPATGQDEFNTPDAGKRFVAVEVAIKNNSNSTYRDDANSDMTLVGSDTQEYSPDFDSVSECTNFNGGSYELAPGDAESGCVLFQLPESVSPAKVQFNVYSDQSGEWQVQ